MAKKICPLYIDEADIAEIDKRAVKKDWSRNKWICHLIKRALRER